MARSKFLFAIDVNKNVTACSLIRSELKMCCFYTPPTTSILLKVYNHVWESGCFLPLWREAVVISIPKPGKDHWEPSNFRPIALTSCLCKTMERMINAHLMWFLESQGLLSEKQCSFRKNHSTLDHLIHFETFIRNAFVKKKNTS